MPSEPSEASRPWVLQVCHGYDGPFLDCARQYAALFSDTPFRVCTVFLTGEPCEEVARRCAADEVVFLSYSSKEVRGLKLSAIQRLRQISQGRDYRLCIAHRFKPIYVSLLATRLPVVAVHHAFGVYERPMRRWFINRFKRRMLLIGVSNAVRDEMRSYLTGWPADRIETLYNRIDIKMLQAEQLPREMARKHLGLPDSAWVVGNVGRLHPDKDQETLIRGFAAALPKLPTGAQLAIMGKGRLEFQLKALVEELGIADSVIFLGQIKDGRKYFKAFDVFALSSDHEPFGMVLLEAMSAGLPVISCATGGAVEVVSGLGWLFPLRDSAALASRLLDVAGMNESELKSLSQALMRCLMDRYTDDAVRPVFFKHIKTLRLEPVPLAGG